MPGAMAADLPGIPQFINEMVAKHHFKRSELERLFHRAQYKQSVIDAITTPATTKPWPEYRAIFVNDQRIQAGLKFWKHYRHTLRRAEKQYGVPQEIIVALIAAGALAFGDAVRLVHLRGRLMQVVTLGELEDILASYLEVNGL